MSSNLERASLLFNVIKAAAEHGPTYAALAAEAAVELRALNDEAVKEQQAKAAEIAKAKAAEAESKRIFPEGSGVQEDHDPPKVQRKV